MAGFSDSVRRFKSTADRRTSEVLQLAVADLLARVVVGSPVDTGRFRGAWQITIGVMPASEPGGTDRGGGETIARGEAALASASVGPAIYLTNAVPYALKLEYGHSMQAPAGVVRMTARQWPDIVRRAARATP